MSLLSEQEIRKMQWKELENLKPENTSNVFFMHGVI